MLTAGTALPALAQMGNREGRDDFTVRWGWNEPLAPGVTAVLRVKNEAVNLPYVLPPLLDAVRAVVIVDNQSTDGTAQVARDLAQSHGASERLTVHDYPFEVSRCGPEHLATPADSVHSLSYFYNWSFSHVRTMYALKWDGDMVPTARGVRAIRDLEWQLEGVDRIVLVRRRAFYVRDRRTAYVDTELMPPEPSGWRNAPDYRFGKAFEWEIPLWPQGTRAQLVADWTTLEIKRLDQDEFDHWSTEDFEHSSRTRRKRRERVVFAALARGEEPPEGVVRIDAPDGVDVVDYARSSWLTANRQALDELALEVSDLDQA